MMTLSKFSGYEQLESLEAPFRRNPYADFEAVDAAQSAYAQERDFSISKDA